MIPKIIQKAIDDNWEIVGASHIKHDNGDSRIEFRFNSYLLPSVTFYEGMQSFSYESRKRVWTSQTPVKSGLIDDPPWFDQVRHVFWERLKGQWLNENY